MLWLFELMSIYNVTLPLDKNDLEVELNDLASPHIPWTCQGLDFVGILAYRSIDTLDMADPPLAIVAVLLERRERVGMNMDLFDCLLCTIWLKIRFFFNYSDKVNLLTYSNCI